MGCGSMRFGAVVYFYGDFYRRGERGGLMVGVEVSFFGEKGGRDDRVERDLSRFRHT